MPFSHGSPKEQPCQSGPKEEDGCGFRIGNRSGIGITRVLDCIKIDIIDSDEPVLTELNMNWSAGC